MMADLLAPIPKSRAHHGSPFNGLLELGILDALLQMESSMLQSKFVSLAKGNFASLPGPALQPHQCSSMGRIQQLLIGV